MAFTWILGKRFRPAEDTVEDELRPARQREDGQDEQNQDQNQRHQDSALSLADIMLSVEDGLVMAFGPHGDPVPPELLMDACSAQPEGELRLPNGFAVDHERLIEVLKAQQNNPLAERPTDRWVEAMLGAEGGFEPTPTACLASEEAEGKSMLASRLALDMPGGETITLCDAHPGNARLGAPVKLLIDGKPMSIEAALGRAARDEPGDGLSSIPEALITRRGDAMTLLLGDQVEARLETTSSVWDGEAKVDLLSSDGRQVAIDDLTALPKDVPPPCTSPEESASAASYPLLGRDGPAFDLERGTIATVSDMPDGWSLTAGLESEKGSWMLDPSDLKSTSVQMSGADAGPRNLTIEVISIVGRDGTLEKQTRTVVIPPVANAGGTEPRAASAPCDEPSSDVRLAFDEAAICQAALADALLLRGIPEGASLSAGICDPGVKGWIVRPAFLDQLVIRDLDQETKTIEIELSAIYLGQEGPPRADVIARKSISVGASTQPADRM